MAYCSSCQVWRPFMSHFCILQSADIKYQTDGICLTQLSSEVYRQRTKIEADIFQMKLFQSVATIALEQDKPALLGVPSFLQTQGGYKLKTHIC